MLFEQFREQFPAVVDCLVRARQNGRMAHAYLVHGDTPEIRRDFPIVLAQIVLCPDVPEHGRPCGTCECCEKLAKGTYPELYMLMPTGKTWAIPVGDRNNPEPNTVRWFNNVFYLTSTSEFSKKIGILFDADRMKSEAQNAFLKTLEEPPPDTMFILTSGNPSALLPTTRSRCQLLTLLENHCSFDFPGNRDLFQALYDLQFKAVNDLPEAESCAARLFTVSAGLKEQAEESTADEWQERLEISEELENPVKKRIQAQYDAAVSGEYIRLRHYFVSAVHTWFAQIYQLSRGGSRNDLANPEMLEGLELPAVIDEKAAFNALRRVDKLLFDLKFNVNEELAFRAFCINLAVNP
jgi:hypothetical protein